MNLFYCIIENIIDPDKLGRVQIRVIGKDTDNRTDTTKSSYLPVEDLIWANCIFPVQSGNISGQCDFAVPANGSVGVCAFLDKYEQHAILLGTVPKFVENLPDFNSGFSDPDGINPKSDFVGESQISRLARNENINLTFVPDKIENVETDVKCSSSKKWSEPETPYDVEYPMNRVIETPAGHVIELDSTDGAERIHIYHKSGTFTEYHPNGDIVEKVTGKKYDITISDKNILVKGDYNIKIEGDENKNVEGDINTLLTGKFGLKNADANLYTVLSTILTRMKSLKTFGSPTQHQISTEDITAIEALQTDLDKIMKA